MSTRWLAQSTQGGVVSAVSALAMPFLAFTLAGDAKAQRLDSATTQRGDGATATPVDTSRTISVGAFIDSAPAQVIVQTQLPSPFVTWGGSLGVDVKLAPQLFWRSEVRGFSSRHAVWPTHDAGVYASRDGFFVTSLSLTL